MKLAKYFGMGQLHLAPAWGPSLPSMTVPAGPETVTAFSASFCATIRAVANFTYTFIANLLLFGLLERGLHLLGARAVAVFPAPS